MRIIFMGTPHFAIASLEILLNNGYNVVAVVTTPDKPSGRGQKLSSSPIKQYAIEKNILVLQPDKLNEESFIETVKSLNPDLQIVVAFRKLPKVLWDLPSKGTFNLHASLLPDYRGAAPMNWAIINGEKETGLTTFFLNDKIDEGKILLSEKVSIADEDSLGDLHDKMMSVGANLLLETVRAIEKNEINPIDQFGLLNNKVVKMAPKIFKEDCRIDWAKNAIDIINLIRGLNPIPTAFTELVFGDGTFLSLKIFKASAEFVSHEMESGKIITDNKSYLKITCKDAIICLQDIQLAGKKRMNVKDFLRGFIIKDKCEIKK